MAAARPRALPVAALIPLTLLLLGGFFALRAVGGSAAFRARGAWALRAALAVLFLFAVVDLVRDVATLTL